MANQGAPFQMDPFAVSQHLQDQNQGQAQAHRGMPQGLVSSWSDPQELHRQQNVAMLSQQISAAQMHQMNQAHQGTPNTMNMLANRDLASQLHRQTPRAAHPVMGSQGQYPQLGGQQQQQGQPQFSHPNMAQNLGQNMNLNPNSTAQNPTAHLMPLPQQQPRPNPNSLPFTPAGNYGQVMNNAALQRQLHNLQTGIANGPSQIQRAPSFSNQPSMQQGPSSQLAVEFQQSIQMVGTIEGQFREFQLQAKTAVGTRDISTLRSVKERLGENLKRAQEERDKWQRSLSNRAWPPDAIERIVNQISSLVQRWSENANKIELMMKNLDGAIQQFAQQTLQNNRASNGGMSQQQWPGMQNTPQTQPSHMNPANGGLGTTFSNPGANSHPGGMNMSAMQQRPSVGGSGQGLPSDQDPIRRNLASILAGHNMEPTVFIAGHLIDLYNLFVVGRQSLQRPGGYNNNQVWQAVGAQLGLPSEGQPPLASAQAAAMLQEYYYKVNAIIEATKTNHIQSSTNQTGITPPNPNPPMSVSPVPGGGAASQQQISANYMVLQRAKQVYPTADFTSITQQMLANIPTARFEQLLRDMGGKGQVSASNNVPGGLGLPGNNNLGMTNTGGSAPPRPNSAVQIQRGQTPAGQRQDAPQQSQQQQPMQQPQLQPMPGQGQVQSQGQGSLSPQQIAEVKGVHQQVQAMWRARYQTRENPVGPPAPANLQTYRERLSSSMALLRIFLPALGLRYFLKKDDNELKNLVNFTSLIVKQLTGLQNNPPAYYLSLESLSRICMLLQPIANEFNAMLQRINITPELQAVMSSGETAARNLWGYMSQANPMQRPGVPQPGPNPQSLNQPGFSMVGAQVANHGMQMSATPVPPSMSTPVAHPVPTPPHHPGQPVGPGSITSLRRGAFSDLNSSSPHNHLTPPASNVTPHTPPAASPPKGKSTRRATNPGAQRRRPSKAANTPTHVQTPTPAAEPVSTPATVATPAQSVGQKRPHDDVETPSNQAEHPSKRSKPDTPQPPPVPSQPPPTTIAPPAMVKVPTPPPQLSAPIERSQVKTETDAKALVTEAFNRSAEVDSGIQNPSDLLNFLNQLMNTTPAVIEPEASTSAQEPEPLPTTLADEGDGADLFDFGMYYADTGQSTVPDLEDKQNTVSPESHNDVTNTPPSQSNAPARAGAGATNKAAVVPKQEPQVNSFLDDDLLGFDTTFLEGTFSYSGPVNPLEEPWAIAQG